MSNFNWDGRAPSLESQIAGPITDPAEMANHDFSDVARRLTAQGRYPVLFLSVFGSDTVTPERIAAALAAFERGLDRKTDFDRFLQGDTARLSDAELRGLHVFRTRAGCLNCHNGPLLSDGLFHNIGLSYFGRRYEDLGRYGVTGDPADAGRFRTPSLRHVADTGPYMHNGLFPNLRGVLNFYNAGGVHLQPKDAAQAADPLFQGAAVPSPLLKPLDLSPQELADLEAFLKTL